MKATFFIALILKVLILAGQGNKQNKSDHSVIRTEMSDFNQFINSFPLATLPLNTKKFNNYKISNELKSIDRNLCLKYIFNNDTNLMNYDFINHDMTTGQPTTGILPVEVRAAFRIDFQDYKIVCFSKWDDISKPFQLISYDINGNRIDSLIINNKIGNTEYTEYLAAKIDVNSIIKLYNFELNEDINKNDYYTKLTISYFHFNHLSGKFEKLKVEKLYKKCSVDEYARNEENCFNDDPMF